jgi:hypothetical protein
MNDEKRFNFGNTPLVTHLSIDFFFRIHPRRHINHIEERPRQPIQHQAIARHNIKKAKPIQTQRHMTYNTTHYNETSGSLLASSPATARRQYTELLDDITIEGGDFRTDFTSRMAQPTHRPPLST